MTPVAATVDELTTAWLTAALGTDVVSVEAKPIGGGQMAATYRLSLAFADPARQPERVVAKLAAVDQNARAVVSEGYRKEVTFYQDVAATVDIRVPRCFHAAIAEDRLTFTLLLEDLGDALAGSQADGGSWPTALAAVRNLARLHAPRWSDASLRTPRYWRPVSAASAAYVGKLHIDATESFCDRYHDRLTSQDAATLKAAASVTERWLQARQEPFAPIHGDYRLDNLMTGLDGEIVAVDWQGLDVGPPLRDVAFFLGTSFEPAFRRQHERELVSAYHDDLLHRGIQDYSLERCFDDYRVGHFQGLFVTVLGSEYAVARTDVSDAMFVTMATRSCAAISDLDSIQHLLQT